MKIKISRARKIEKNAKDKLNKITSNIMFITIPEELPANVDQATIDHTKSVISLFETSIKLSNLINSIRLAIGVSNASNGINAISTKIQHLDSLVSISSLKSDLDLRTSVVRRDRDIEGGQYEHQVVGMSPSGINDLDTLIKDVMLFKRDISELEEQRFAINASTFVEISDDEFGELIDTHML